MHRNNCALSDLKLRSCLSLLCQQKWGRNKNANLVWLGPNRQENFFVKTIVWSWVGLPGPNNFSKIFPMASGRVIGHLPSGKYKKGNFLFEQQYLGSPCGVHYWLIMKLAFLLLAVLATGWSELINRPTQQIPATITDCLLYTSPSPRD